MLLFLKKISKEKKKKRKKRKNKTLFLKKRPPTPHTHIQTTNKHQHIRNITIFTEFIIH